jgi:glycosyltransferase involved in cell wall biosynthesis
MHVAIVAPEFPPEFGGMQTYACEFALELARRGNRVTVLTRSHPDGEASLPGIDVVPALQLRRNLDRHLVRAHVADVWHVMNASYAWVGLETSPVVASVHGNDFLRPYLPVDRPDLGMLPVIWRSTRWRYAIENAVGQWMTRRLVGQALPRLLHIFTNSRYTERALLQAYPACRGLTSAAMVGVSQSYFAAPLAQARSGAPKFITVCRLAERRKNVDAVLRARSTLKHRHTFSYVVVGDGPLRPDFETLAAELGLRDRVQFAGYVATDELRRLLGESDLFVLPSSIQRDSHEGFGIAYLEANACGTPVLAARLAGAVEAVDEGRSGFFVERPEPDAIAKALDRFLTYEIAFDRAVCRTFAARFTWDKVVDHSLGYYPGRS